MKKRIIIMGAAGRDFHNFNVLYRNDPSFHVVAFTAAQIPFIQDRTYPKELAGPDYPEGIPIYPEEELPHLIKGKNVDAVVFSYSDVSHNEVGHKASIAAATGADFVLLGSERTMLKSEKPVISVCAVRTGCGKSGVTRFVGGIVSGTGKRPVAIRHPMPYGDLLKQRSERYSTLDDVKNCNCTIEEMEEYEPLVNSGITVYAGVDYEEILRRAEGEADIILWDGGNNDLPFIKPDLELVVVDPLRPGHELLYWPGEANLRRADCVVINKAGSAKTADIQTVVRNVKDTNYRAEIVLTESKVFVTDPGAIKNKKVLVIEDGPTLTHGGMAYGAGITAAALYGAEPVDPRPYSVGSIKDTLRKYPHLENLVPAMGYSKEQIWELEKTVNSTPCDAVLVATPVNLANIITLERPVVRVSYEVRDMDVGGRTGGLRGVIEKFLEKVH
jgi:predicted GTPase